MNRTFKKAIATLLAVLMVAFSVPFTASAASVVEDWSCDPNINLQFSAIGNFLTTNMLAGEGAYDNAGKKDRNYETALSYSGPYGAQLDYDMDAGTLTLSAEKSKDFIDFANDEEGPICAEIDYLTEDYVYQVGDYFVLTVTLENTDLINTFVTYINYSDNIEPAGIYTYGSGTNRYQAIVTGDGSEYEDGSPNSSYVIQEVGEYISGLSWETIYSSANGYGYTSDAGTMSTFSVEDSYFNPVVVCTLDTGYDMSSTVSGSPDEFPFFSPEDGSINYEYTDTGIIESYIFKIVDEGAISFWIQDTDNSIHGDYTGGELVRLADYQSPSQYYTYAINTYVSAGDFSGEENPGSTKLSFMGTNVNWTTEECTHDSTTLTGYVASTCSTAGYSGDYVCDDCGEVVTAGEALALDPDNHEGEITSAVTEATCTEQGYTTYTCSACGVSWTADYTDAVGHTAGETVVENEVEATCTTDGSYDNVVYCTVCDEELSREPVTVPATGHSYDSATFTFSDDYSTATATLVCTNCGESITVDADVTSATTPATATENGSTVYTATATVDGVEYTDTATVVIPATGYTYSSAPVFTWAEDYSTATATFTADEDETVTTTVDAVVTSVETAATCTVDGSIVYTATATFNDATYTDTATVTLTAPGHTASDAVVENEVAATCTTDGSYDEVVYCSVCNEEISRTPVTVAAKGHTEGETVIENEVAATCTTDGSYDEVVYCTECGAEISRNTVTVDATGHTAGEPEVVTVDATFDSEGSVTTTVYCTECGAVISQTVETLDKLVGYDITVDATDLGTVTLNGTDVTEGATITVEAGSTYTLTATPVDGAAFLGWTANGLTTVSTSTTFTTTALADVTYTPVFEVVEEDEFTVQFLDSFGNIVSAQNVSSGADVVIPDAPNRAGYSYATTNGWSMTDDEIAALTAAASITAQYTKDEATLYTITANGCEITANGETVADTVDVAYDTLVTVTSTGAEAWAIAGTDTVVAYGESYSFYVTADLELEVVSGVTATPTVANVGVGETTTSSGLIKAVFKATRTMTDDCTYISSGWVYGKGDLGEITLDDVDGSAVKAAYNATSVEQFTLTYGLSAQSGTMTARAFLAYTDASGATVVIYTEPMTYTYA